MSDTLNQSLFDRIVNVRLIKKGGIQDVITVPVEGIKPSIGISGEFVVGSLVTNLDLRITNFYPETPLNEYEYVEIDAGYKGVNTYQSAMVQASIKGKIWLAYQESPSPDGVTYFQVQTASTYIEYLNADCTNYWATGRQLSEVIDTIAQYMTIACGRLITAKIYLPVNYPLTSKLDWNGTLKDLLQEIQNTYRIEYRLDGDNIVVWAKDGTTQEMYNINFFSSPPIRSGAGITFTAPWIASLRPADRITIDPKYLKMTFGGRQTIIKNILKVQSIVFNFNTVTGQNQMTVLALDVL